jgi:hypothetical protein
MGPALLKAPICLFDIHYNLSYIPNILYAFSQERSMADSRAGTAYGAAAWGAAAWGAAYGTIVVVQEERFRLLTASGQGLLLTLARTANATRSDLLRWQRARTPLFVAYSGEPNLASGVAQRLLPQV